ncbi:hypothetical protein BN946_scf185013.g118 [Trametes cinnabarina]|uniref:Uncharacterized protein n=1 Tax=Pycnoporus cinnabarinus TaxID=5643 RepID=A0A060SM39_PYCCI|nr:hypothetical protein BN946_scf185013.g118 [Trametes cinnabarina]
MAQKYPIPPPEKFLGLATTSVGCGPGGGTPMIAYVHPHIAKAAPRHNSRSLRFSFISRVAVVDYRGQVLFSTHVLPTNPVTDYRTSMTGIQAADLQPVLGIPHPAVATRDVALYQPFRNALRSTSQVIGLQTLMWHLMRRRVQETHVCAIENARAALDLYRSHAEEWEGAIARGQWPSFLPPSTFSRCYL